MLPRRTETSNLDTCAKGINSITDDDAMHALLARATTIPFCRVALRNAKSVSTRRGASVVTMSARKGGVASDEEFDAFVSKNDGKTIFVVDARNPDFSVEPDDETSGARPAPRPSPTAAPPRVRTR